LNRAGILLDTGPLVALLSREDARHHDAKRLFDECSPPFRCCEAVIAEACFLLKKVHEAGPAEVLALGRVGVYEIALDIDKHWVSLESLLRKYRRLPASLADACLIRCAEIFDEPRIATFDSDFRIYRWEKNRTFQIL
jgi:predicted nucleic acid-binding protein